MFGGLKLQDLFVGIVVAQAALTTILLVALFSICNFLIFTILPIIEVIIGILLLVSPDDISAAEKYFPILVSLQRRELHSTIFAGYFLASGAWSSYFVGYATKPLVKIVYALILSYISLRLISLDAQGK